LRNFRREVRLASENLPDVDMMGPFLLAVLLRDPPIPLTQASRGQAPRRDSSRPQGWPGAPDRPPYFGISLVSAYASAFRLALSVV
jgi:hypothetical protein